MKKIVSIAKQFVVKHGGIIASCAFAFVVFTSNSSSMVLFYEPNEPDGIEKFKKFNA